jgi:hypothetical protein
MAAEADRDREPRMSDQELASLEATQSEFSGFGVTDLSSVISASALWIATQENEARVPLLIEFPLGRRHFKLSRN